MTVGEFKKIVGKYNDDKEILIACENLISLRVENYSIQDKHCIVIDKDNNKIIIDVT